MTPFGSFAFAIMAASTIFGGPGQDVPVENPGVELPSPVLAPRVLPVRGYLLNKLSYDS